LNIDFILGNSFGGEVAVRYKTLINPLVPIILIVPAILRKSPNSKEFINTPNIFNPLRNILRNLYVIYIKNTPEMKYGTKFLRNSYQKIVRCNLINEVKKFKENEILVLLGMHDNMVDTAAIYDELSKKYDNNIYKISGGHEIIETHRDELLHHILKFTLDK
jgi:esterase/lipase